MDQAHLLKVLADLKAKNIRPHPHTGHFQMSCLLAPWTHLSHNGKPGEDRHPSLSVSFKHEVSLAHCFAGGCSFGGTFYQYVSLYNQYVEGQASGIVDTVRYLERADPEVKLEAVGMKYEIKRLRSQEVADIMEAYEDTELSTFERKLKRSFIQSRGISEEIGREYCLMWEERSHRVVVPVRRRIDGKLIGAVGRCWCDKCQKNNRCETPYHNYWMFPKEKYLFNETKLDPTKPCYVVEGIFDCLKMISVGYTNTAAIMGSSMSETQVTKLARSKIYLMFDGDPAGRKCTMQSIELIRQKMPMTIIQECMVPDGKDPGDMTAEELKITISASKGIL